MGYWEFIFLQLVINRFQTLFYFGPQEKDITVKLQLVAIVQVTVVEVNWQKKYV